MNTLTTFVIITIILLLSAIIFILPIFVRKYIFIYYIKIYYYMFLSFIRKELPNIITTFGLGIVLTQFLPLAGKQLKEANINLDFFFWITSWIPGMLFILLAFYFIGILMTHNDEAKNINFIINDIQREIITLEEIDYNNKKVVEKLDKIKNNYSYFLLIFRFIQAVIIVFFILMMLIILGIVLQLLAIK